MTERPPRPRPSYAVAAPSVKFLNSKAANSALSLAQKFGFPAHQAVVAFHDMAQEGPRRACHCLNHATRTLLKGVARCVAGAHGNPRLRTEDQVAPKVADSTSSTSILRWTSFLSQSEAWDVATARAKKNASPSSRNRTSDQLISCIPLQSIALPTEKHSSVWVEIHP